MIWVTAEDVVAIHSRIIQVSGGLLLGNRNIRFVSI